MISPLRWPMTASSPADFERYAKRSSEPARPRHAELAELVQRPPLGRLERHHQQVVLALAGVDEDAAATERRAGADGEPVAAPRSSRLMHGWARGDVDHLDPGAGVDLHGEPGEAAHAVERIEEHLVARTSGSATASRSQSGRPGRARHLSRSVRIGP